MRAWIVPAGCTDPAGLRMVEQPVPVAGPGQIVVRIRAASLNYRDQAVVRGTYFGGATPRDLVPVSDGAGEVVSVGAGVASAAVGDRVAGTFFQPTPHGPAALGSPVGGGAWLPRYSPCTGNWFIFPSALLQRWQAGSRFLQS